MSRSDLVKMLASKKRNLRSEEISNIINLVFSAMADGLVANGKIEIRGFGTMRLRKRKSRTNARDPRTGQLISIGERYIPSFRIGQDFFNKINPDQPK